MTARYHPSTCGRWIIEVIPDDPHGEARILSLEDASDRLAMHKRLQMDFLQSDATATRLLQRPHANAAAELIQAMRRVETLRHGRAA